MILQGLSLLYPIWLRARWSLLVGLSLLIVATVLLHMPMFSSSNSQVFNSAQVIVWLVGLFPMTICFGRVLNACTYWNGDLNSTSACFPSHMLVLPVRTRTLVAWPMFFGGALSLTWWLFVARILLRPAGVAAPLIWPGILLATIVAATQLTAWSPVPSTFVRVFSGLSIIFFIGAFVLIGLYLQFSSAVMTLGSFLILSLEYLAIANRLAVARRGDGQTWPQSFLRLRALPLRQKTDDARPSRRFTSPLAAQIWFDARVLLWLMPRTTVVCSIISSTALAAPFALPGKHQGRGEFIAVGPYMASAACFSLSLWFVTLPMASLIFSGMYGRFTAQPKDSGISSFFSARPLSSSHFVLSKLIVAALSAGVTYLIAVFVCFGASFFVSYPPGQGQSLARFLFEGPSARPLWIVIIAIAVLAFSTWRKLVIDMYAGLCTSSWIKSLSAMGSLAPMVALAAGVIVHQLYPATFLRIQHVITTHAVPLFACIALLKCVLAIVTFTMLYRLALMSMRSIVVAVGAWAALGIAIFIAAEHYISSPFLPRPLVLAAGLVLSLPLVRLSVAPLALHWNRHR